MDHTFNETSPKYKQIYDHLLKEISAGKLKPQDKVPSEKELCEIFSVSRITSKKALEMLTENRLISRQRGKGSFVIGNPAKTQAALRTIAFIISEFNDSFGSRLINSIETECAILGYNLVIKLTHEAQSKEEEILRELDDEKIAGILMLPVHGVYYSAEILRQILNKRPIVFVDRKMRGLPVPSVSTDCVLASEMAVKRLLAQGHKNIAFFSGPVIHTSTVEDRLQGYIAAFAGSKIPLNDKYIFNNLASLSSVEIIKEYLSENPEITAAFTVEFEIALVVRRALKILGRKIPQDFALITFDRPDYAEDFPEFSCLKQDEDAIGRQAVELLNRIIQGEDSQSIKDILIPAEFFEGLSNIAT